MNEAFLIDLYYWLQHSCNVEQFAFRVTLSSYLSGYNHFHNILRLFDVLSNFLFTTSEMMRDYYLQSCHIFHATRAAVQPSNLDPRELRPQQQQPPTGAATTGAPQKSSCEKPCNIHGKDPRRSPLPTTKLRAPRRKRPQRRRLHANIAKSLTAATLKNIPGRLPLYSTDSSDQLVFREAIFQNSLSNILFLTLTSLLFHLIHLFHLITLYHLALSFYNFISDSHAK